MASQGKIIPLLNTHHLDWFIWIIIDYSTTLMKRLTAGTAINDAIAAGQRFDDCEQKFAECKMKSKGLEPFFEFFSHSIHWMLGGEPKSTPKCDSSNFMVYLLLL